MKPIKVSYHPARFVGRRHSRDKMVFIFDMTLQNPPDQSFITLWFASHHPAKFGGHGHCGSGDIMLLVCQGILQDHIVKPSCDFMGRSP